MAQSPRAALTRTQRRVLDYVADGLGNKEIAAVLNISETGAKKHVAALCRRYGADSRVSLIRKAIEVGELSFFGTLDALSQLEGSACSVLARAQHESWGSHVELGPDHVLLAIVATTSNSRLRALCEFERVRAEVDRARADHGRRQKAGATILRLLAECARDEAQRTGSDTIRADHLVLGLARMAEIHGGPAADLLRRLGVTTAELRGVMLRESAVELVTDSSGGVGPRPRTSKVMRLTVSVPPVLAARVQNDLRALGAEVVGIHATTKGRLEIRATADVATVEDYGIRLRQVTDGHGTFNMIFDHFASERT